MARFQHVALDPGLHEVPRCTLHHLGALVHDEHRVADLGSLFHVVSGQEDREALPPELAQLVPDQVPHLGIQAGCGLIKDEKARTVEQCPGNDEPALHPA